MKKQTIRRFLILGLAALGLLSACGRERSAPQESNVKTSVEQLPAYQGEPYVEIDGNEPSFPKEDKTTRSFEAYGELDALGRCTYAYANIGEDLMPKEKRGSIGQVKPSGWKTVKYDVVEGKYLYNRAHLIGWQLTAENANEQNLITGTRYMNTEGMLPFENMVADYIKESGNHVLYRVIPHFVGSELVARGVEMEAQSIEDEGAGISFHVFVYNVQPQVEIDYQDGSSRLAEWEIQDEEAPIRGNKRSKVYHCPGQSAYEEMEDSKNLIVFKSEEEAQAAGYRRAKR